MVKIIELIESQAPDWVWSPKDNWSRYKGVGRIAIFIGIVLYGIGLLGMRMALERRRKQEGSISNE